MSYKINDQQFKAVLALPAPKRYEHFIKRVAEMEEVWSLGADDGWVLLGDDDGRGLVPVWPHERYAQACARGEWASNRPRPISLEDWLEKWTPGMERDGRLVAVFPTPEGKGIPVTPERLKADLEEEMKLYE